MNMLDRRSFLVASAATTVPLIASIASAQDRSTAGAKPQAATGNKSSKPPVVISSGNGLRAVEKAMDLIKSGGDPLAAIVAGINIVEDDPNDNSVGYGGLPNENGVVELDASVMHGPTARGGAVAALQNIKNPSNVARLV